MITLISLRNSELFELSTITQLESARQGIYTSDDLKDNFKKVRDLIAHVEDGLIFNIDETATRIDLKGYRKLSAIPKETKSNSQNSAGSTSQTAGKLANLEIEDGGKTVPKSMTMLEAITKDGFILIPYIIVPNNHLWSSEIPDQEEKDKDGNTKYLLHMAMSERDWINYDLFFHCIVTCSIPQIEQKRAREGKTTEESLAVLLMDGHNSHHQYRVFYALQQHNIRIIFMPPHTSHRLQHLDVVFFGIFKILLCATIQKTITKEFMKSHVFDISWSIH
ncbi:unnamed protein product [Ambrosiozyma monospora]|uniref:Unnamed protein product n=1 Tax=Ambrosiozyma monospora TaxID=43982 RepID=A0ACB5T968_AMBMO|nr:unnamed protein product [Ambrosiozyma monospora]